MSYYSSSDVNKLAKIYKNDVIFNESYKLKLIEEGLLDNLKKLSSKVVDWFNKSSITTTKDLQNYFRKKFEVDHTKTGQPTVDVEGYLKEWLIQNFLIITDANGNSSTNPTLYTKFKRGEERRKINPSAFSGSSYFAAYANDPLIKATLTDWLNDFGSAGSGASSARLAVSSVSVAQVFSLIDKVVEELKTTFATISSGTSTPSQENLPYRIIRSAKSQGGTTLDDFISQLGSDYYGKNSKLVSLLPGSADLSSIVSSIATASGISSSPSYTSPLASLSSGQAKNVLMGIFNDLKSQPAFAGISIPSSSASPQAIAQDLLKFAQGGRNQAEAVFKLMFPQLMP